MSEVDDNRLDPWLDAALASYSQAEPPAGMEQRILSALRRLESERPGRGMNWGWLATTAAVLLAAAIGFSVWQAPWGRPAPVADHRNTGTGPSDRGTGVSTPRLAAANTMANSGRRPATRVAGVVAEARLPRQATFPAPEPASEQDRLLLVFASSAPGEAAEVAAGQQRFQQDGFEALVIPPISIPAIRMEE